MQIILLFSLTKSTLNSSTGAASVSRPNQTPRIATVKFDYDASDHNELSVLAKEVKNQSNIFLSVLFKNKYFVLDCKHHCRRQWKIYSRIRLDYNRKTKHKRTGTCTKRLSKYWYHNFLITNSLSFRAPLRLPKHENNIFLFR